MAKIIRAREMARVEKLSYQEGASEEQFMRRAGREIAKSIRKMIGQLHLGPNLLFLCGKGNNGGDGYVAATHLAAGGFHLCLYSLSTFEESSPLSQKMRKEYERTEGTLFEIKKSSEIDFSGVELIVDGLLGTGFKGELPLLYHEVIVAANQSKIPIFAIDIPSGISGNEGAIGKAAIRATKTLFLGLPKTGCFLGDAFAHLGEIEIGDFGLEERFVDQAVADFILLEKERVRSLLPPLERRRHKYQVGYLVGIGGSPSMPGAAILASEAALHAGCGMVRLMHPEGMGAELGRLAPEVIRQPYREGDIVPILEAARRARAYFIGPGMGRSEGARLLLTDLLPKVELPSVIDAEALTLIAQEQLPLPKGAVLTPHRGEMMRLLSLEGQTLEEERFLELCRSYAEKHQITLLLKGAPTFIFHPGQLPYIMARGDCGMATAGSGDVLTGIIGSLLAQGRNSLEAALLGSYLHAIAGEYAARAYTSYSMIASDITYHLPAAFRFLLNTNGQTV